MGVYGTPNLSTVNAIRIDIHDVDFVAQPQQYLLSYVSLTAARQITLPDCVVDLDGINKVYIIKDETGLANTYPISVVGFGSPGSRQPVDGIESGAVINSTKGSMTVVSNGVSWYIV